MPIEVIVVLATCFLRLGELRLHQVNKRFLLENGAKQWLTKIPNVLLYVEWATILLMLVERVFAPRYVGFVQMNVAALILVLALTLRLWARFHLGRMWTLGLFYIPGVERVEQGPYKFLSHPEYLSRAMEQLGLALFLGTYYSFGIYAGACLILLPKLVILERRQINLLST